jgi:hypothetical protein
MENIEDQMEILFQWYEGLLSTEQMLQVEEFLRDGGLLFPENSDLYLCEGGYSLLPVGNWHAKLSVKFMHKVLEC